MVVAVVLLVLARAESDPYFAWRSPPRDSSAALDRAVNAALAIGLRDARAGSTCREAAAAMTAPLATTAQYFFVGPVRSWELDTVPRPGEEAALVASSVYREAPLFPFGHLIPLDPTISAGGVWFGTDKIGHFFTNGLRAFDRFAVVRTRGASEATAVREAISLGVDEENGWLGLGVCGVFSTADIHANLAGLRFYRALCDGGELRELDGRWQLTVPFRISRWVDPCWDESFAPSAFSPSEVPAIDAALPELCPLLETAPVRNQRAAYRRRGCAPAVATELSRLVAVGVAPDASRWSIDVVCAASAASSQ